MTATDSARRRDSEPSAVAEAEPLIVAALRWSTRPTPPATTRTPSPTALDLADCVGFRGLNDRFQRASRRILERQENRKPRSDSKSEGRMVGRQEGL